MPALRSRTVTHGRNMAGARALMRATGVERTDFGKQRTFRGTVRRSIRHHSSHSRRPGRVLRAQQ